jgi:hypothetical protein
LSSSPSDASGGPEQDPSSSGFAALFMDQLYFFSPGEFVKWNLQSGDACIGRVLSVTQTTLSVSRWEILPVADGVMEAYDLPPVLNDAREIHIIPIPLISSLVFVFKESEILSYDIHYVSGMQHIYCTSNHYDLRLNPQSLTSIIFCSLTKISLELQRVLSNRRENQEVFSSFTLEISNLTWQFIKGNLNVCVAERNKVFTHSVPSGKDLSTTRVKARNTCYLLRVDDRAAISQIVSMFGVSAVVGVRKKPPAVIKKLSDRESYVSSRSGVQRLDVINLVDVSLNDNLPHPTNVTFNARGRKGIDFIYCPKLSSLKMSIRYKQYVVIDAIDKLYDLGIALPRAAAPLTDDELEAMLRP